MGVITIYNLWVHGKCFAVRGLLFDKDGTLLEFVGLWGGWSEALIRHFTECFPADTRQLIADQFPALLGAHVDSKGRIVDYDRNGPLAMASTTDLLSVLAWHGYRLGLPWSEAMTIVRRCKLAADEEMQKTRPVRALPGLKEFLERCHALQIPLGVVTADDTVEAEKHLDWMGIRQYFQVVIGNDLVGTGKPDPEMVEKACRQLRCSPNEVGVIGDTNGDMKMGRAAGAALTIGFCNRKPTDSKDSYLLDADALITDYAQVGIERSTMYEG
ncbi:HAD family hydrolase [Paenibacillus filicis]|uniref:HAD family hydrolase n=1 Tax=Paenibacillus gyeongsangnamensis TaxID=3388067 RepID=A0ABT4QI69_9BACL|nr:HAD family hydrolase [Paenibacillus filicis]MCZ8516586.1 HAD family hydrolase [Paenibacillus filicis]